MSTRAMFTFIDGNDIKRGYHVYKHYDGYPAGAAEALTKALSRAWPLPCFEADEFAAAFIAANKDGPGNLRTMPSGSVYAVAPSDIDYRYEVRAKGDVLEVTAYHTDFWKVRSQKNETFAFKGPLAQLETVS